MAHDFSKTKPVGGLDQDSSNYTIDPLSYRFAKNIRNAINAANKGGALTNIMGMINPTKYLLPYNANIFPTGNNRCIGAIEDAVYGTVIFFVWNSTGKHQILRYYPRNTDPNNPYGEVQQIIQYDFGWERTTRITSAFVVYDDPQGQESAVNGDLLYWCDPNPRKINLSKGNVVNKEKGWNIYLPQTVSLVATTNFYFKNFAGTTIFSIGIILSEPTNRQQIITDITDQINASSTCPVVAESCDCKLVLREKVSGTVWTVETDSGQILVSPENWYGVSLIDRFFERIKYPPLQAPQPTFEQDANFEPNYVQKKVFQFRLEYIYDDREQSALGVWSQIPIDNLGCDGTSNPALNYIDVNFNDSTLFDPTVLVLLKQVRLVARELNTGKDRSVIDLTPCDFLDYDLTNNVWFCHFNFYNDIISSAIDDATAAKLYDDVPLTSGAEVFKENRIIEGDCLTGYNPPDCIEAKFKVDFSNDSNRQLWNVSGKIRILTYGLAKECDSGGGNASTFQQFFPSDRKYPYWKPPFVSNMQLPFNQGVINGAPLLRGGIFHDTTRTTNDFAFFGGGSYDNNGDYGIRSGMEDEYDQRIPEGGFPVYATNTDYLTISKQINVGLPQDGIGALDTSSQTNVDAIGEYLYNQNDVPFDLYSTFNMKLPNGVYVIRLASHWCSYGVDGADKLGKGFNYDLNNGRQYQKTSTNVWAVIDANGNWLLEKELTITVNNGDIEIGEFIVADLAPPRQASIGGNNSDYWQPVSCYLVDDFGKTNPNDANYAGIPVEKTLVSVGGYVFTSAIANPLPVTGVIELGLNHMQSSITDHNGYFFQINSGYINGEAPPLVVDDYNYVQITAFQSASIIRRMSTTIGIGSISDYYNKSLSILNFEGNTSYGNGLIFGVVTTNSTLSRASARVVEGFVYDVGGLPVSGVSIVYENGQYTITSPNGNFSYIAWFDAKTAYQGNFALPGLAPFHYGYNRTVDNIIYSAAIFCDITYPNGQFYLLNLAQGTTGFNTPRVVPDFIVDENYSTNGKSLKRGGKYTYALRYYDEGGRLCSVVKAFDIYMPFITEDVNVLCTQQDYYDPTQYPSGTYLHGKPNISWYLDANQKPPIWAATYQWMRTKNAIYGRYLEWVVNQVTYLSAVATTTTPEIVTSYLNYDAVAVKINLSNIITYSASNPDSQIGYQYEAGDRVRIVSSRYGFYVNGINDISVVSYDSATQSIIVKVDELTMELVSGMSIEIYNPKSLADDEEQIFYEVGEVYSCTAPNSPNNQHSVLNALFTNGDTYWRGRLIVVNDDATNYSASYPVVIEDASISDFYVSEAQDIGRIGVIDDNFRQIRRPMLLKASNQYIPSTAVNGLSSFEALNEKELDRNSGAIKRLVSLNQTVVAITTQREVSNYIQVVTFQQATLGDGVIAVANQFFGTQYPHAKTLGTDHSGSVFINNGQIFGYHSQRGDVFKYQGDGEAAISDVKMKTYFQQLSIDGVSEVQTIYDRFHEELIMTIWRNYKQASVVISRAVLPAGYSIGFSFPDGASLPELNSVVSIQVLVNGTWETFSGVVTGITNLESGYDVTIRTSHSFRIDDEATVIFSLPETISWFNGNDIVQKQRWQTFYDFTPEAYSQLGNGIVSFVGGKIWLHDKTTDYNKFYGTQYTTKVNPVFNKEPEKLKVWNSVVLQQLQSDNGCNWSCPNIENDNGQASRINNAGFAKKGEIWYAPFKRDLNDLTVAQNLRISQGRALRSTTLTCEMVNNSMGEILLYSWDANFSLSERTGK